MRNPKEKSDYPKVAILLATYNGELFLREQLDSILSQCGVQLTLFCRDDLSTDSTPMILYEYSNRDPRVVILDSTSRSGRASLNFLEIIYSLDLCEFDYVAFSDQDDVWKEDKLAKSLKAAQYFSGVLVSTAVTAVWPNGRRLKLRQSPSIGEFDFLFEGAGQGCTFLMDQRLFVSASMFIKFHKDLCFSFEHHDWLIYILTRSFGFRWIYLDESTILYRQHPQNETGARFSVKGLMRRYKLIRDGWYTRQVKLAYKIYLTAILGSEVDDKWDVVQPKFSLTSPYRLLISSRRKFIDRFTLALFSILSLFSE